MFSVMFLTLVVILSRKCENVGPDSSIERYLPLTLSILLSDNAKPVDNSLVIVLRRIKVSVNPRVATKTLILVVCFDNVSFSDREWFRNRPKPSLICCAVPEKDMESVSVLILETDLVMEVVAIASESDMTLSLEVRLPSESDRVNE